jgi:hypothetical protein
MIGKIINGSMLYALDPSSGSLFFAFLIFIITFVVAFCLHVYMLISNHFRTSVIDNYYGRYIVSTEEIDKLKKKVNRKYMIIFAISIGFGV